MPKSNLYKTLSEELKELLSPSRYAHSVRVARFSARLAQAHGAPMERARVAGLVHDCVKEWKPSELLKYVQKNKIFIPDLPLIVRMNPNMMHGYVGAHVAHRRGWIKKKADRNAIAFHTIGSLQMGVMEKILFIADFAEPGRRYKKAKTVRRLAMADLNKGFVEAVGSKIRYQIKRNKFVHPAVLAVWNKFGGGVR